MFLKSISHNMDFLKKMVKICSKYFWKKVFFFEKIKISGMMKEKITLFQKNDVGSLCFAEKKALIFIFFF
tara:strand:+ start:489 stop:698 length:210 start_codon:yes stop_codon:yes gene_type:complete